MKNVMKKKTMCLFVVAFIAANRFLSTTPTPGKKSQLTLVLPEARADEPGKTDLSGPDEKIYPTRLYPSDCTLSAGINYFL